MRRSEGECKYGTSILTNFTPQRATVSTSGLSALRRDGSPAREFGAIEEPSCGARVSTLRARVPRLLVVVVVLPPEAVTVAAICELGVLDAEAGADADEGADAMAPMDWRGKDNNTYERKECEGAKLHYRRIVAHALMGP